MRQMTTCLMTAVALLLAASAQAQTIRLTATLSGSSETPGVLTGAAGSAEVFVNLATQAVNYRIDIFNIPTQTTAGHFHVGGPGLAGPVVVDLTPPGVTDDFSLSGAASPSSLRARPDQGIRTWADFIQALAGGQIYVNIHSTANPGGEIRGQLIPDRP
ncbi:MAG: CHRD domain-containing protein [Acidobacteriota bacterium]|nr:CHRD domain-containing protein [Acidobacteriota bacterium]